MKKHLAAAAALLIGAVAVQAQPQVLKDAERALKDGKTPAEVVAIITPAFTNPETAEMAQTWFIPGKAMYDEFNQLYALKQFNKLPENGDLMMANDLLAGYDYYMKALPLDSVVNEKGKVKTKYSKDIINTVAGHYGDYNTAAITYWEIKDYANAYRAWQIFLDIINSPALAAKVPSIPADSLIGEIAYNQALAAWQADSLKNAMASFAYAKSKGYNKKELYDYSLAVAISLGDNDATFAIATEAQQLYGKEDSQYIGHIINKYLQSKEFDTAFTIVDEAIANEPDNSQFYFIKGILYNEQDKNTEAREQFKKAIEMDSENWQALLQYGISLCEEAYAISDQAPADVTESEALYNERIVPLFKEAAEYLEQSWNINNDNPEALRYLENVYYNLKDENMMKDVEQRKLQ